MTCKTLLDLAPAYLLALFCASLPSLLAILCPLASL